MFWVDNNDVKITVNNFSLYGSDSYGCQWHATLDDQSGFYDGTATTLATENKVWTDGYYMNTPTRAGRTISISGHILGSKPETLYRAWETFKGKLLAAETFTVRFNINGYTRWTRCVQSSSEPLVTFAGSNILQFSFSLVSTSAYLYAENQVSGNTGLPYTEGGWSLPVVFDPYEAEETTTTIEDVEYDFFEFDETVAAGNVTLENYGTAPSPVTITITGPVVNPRVEHAQSGRVLAFNLELGVGQYIVCEGSTHEISVNGVSSLYGGATYRQWSTAHVGSNTWRFSASEYNDQARLTVQFYPAYY